jgi:hypothetical protein
MVSGLNEILRAFKTMIPSGDQIQSAFKPVGNQILQDIKTELPKRSGQLADSYTYVRRKYSNGLTIGASYGKGGGNHAHLIELGFNKRNKRGRVEGRFVERKVFDQIRSSGLNLMEKNLANEIEKNWNK